MKKASEYDWDCSLIERLEEEESQNHNKFIIILALSNKAGETLIDLIDIMKHTNEREEIVENFFLNCVKYRESSVSWKYKIVDRDYIIYNF